MSQGETSIWQLVRERRARSAIYHAASYWDARASARTGLARSLWPSNVYNEVWDARQRDVVTRTLGPLAGLRVVDLGCGTGRMSRFLSEEGALEVLGLDFSPASVMAARADTDPGQFPNVQFAVGDVLSGLEQHGAFDVAVVLGCLSVACQDRGALDTAMGHIAAVIKPKGRVLILEPIHRSKLLRRVLDLSQSDWIASANRAGLKLIGSDRMGFVPLRLVLSVRELPSSLVAPLFRAGEALLDADPSLEFMADYKLLLFET